MDSVTEGIIIGATGGGIAGLTVWLVSLMRELIVAAIHKRRIYGWLLGNTEDEFFRRFRSTRTIASYNNLTEDRVRYICSHHKKIALSTGEEEDMWGMNELVRQEPRDDAATDGQSH